MKLADFNKSKLNILMTVLCQIVAVACGIVIPRTMIKNFGSAAYGITTSIAQFLSYISLIEGGIARVARAELYYPLVEKNDYEISRVYYAIKRFFRNVGLIFILYTAALSFVYYDIAHVTDMSRELVFLLIWVISISSLAKYMGGLANLTLLNADQKQYIGSTIVLLTTTLNALMISILANSGQSILTVKTASSIVFVLQPLGYALFVRRQYKLQNPGKNISQLKQKWTGIGQHIAYFLHTNTDVVLLTLFSDIRLVAVYNVYKLVISNIRKIAGSFTGGMEAAFGELISMGEQKKLQNSFWNYKFLLSFVSIILFGTTALMIIPFIKLYTKGINDADYIRPMFAVILLFAETVDCLVHPCCSLPISANKLKETRWGSYAEAVVNIGLSMLLIWWNPLVGIALGTLCAALIKAMYYMFYSAKHILHIRFRLLIKNFLFTTLSIALFAWLGGLLTRADIINNFVQWTMMGFVSVAVVCVFTALASTLVYPQEFKWFIQRFKRKITG